MISIIKIKRKPIRIITSYCRKKFQTNKTRIYIYMYLYLSRIYLYFGKVSLKLPLVWSWKELSLSAKKGGIHRRVVQAPILLESIFCLTLRLLPPYHVSWDLMTNSGWKQIHFSNPSFLAYPVNYFWRQWYHLLESWVFLDTKSALTFRFRGRYSAVIAIFFICNNSKSTL